MPTSNDDGQEAPEPDGSGEITTTTGTNIAPGEIRIVHGVSLVPLVDKVSEHLGDRSAAEDVVAMVMDYLSSEAIDTEEPARPKKAAKATAKKATKPGTKNKARKATER